VREHTVRSSIELPWARARGVGGAAGEFRDDSLGYFGERGLAGIARDAVEVPKCRVTRRATVVMVLRKPHCFRYVARLQFVPRNLADLQMNPAGEVI
jgi:hypothetical protein